MKILNKTLPLLVAVSFSAVLGSSLICNIQAREVSQDIIKASLNDDLWHLQTKEWSNKLAYDKNNENVLAKEDPIKKEYVNAELEKKAQEEEKSNANSEATTENIVAPDASSQKQEDAFLAEASQREGIQKETENDTFSIDFAEEEIRNIIRHIADLYALNVVIPESLSGVISIKLKDVTWPDVFRAILDPIGFTYIQDGKILKIKSIQDVNTEPTQTRIFPLKFSDANLVMGSILPLIDKELGGRVLADGRTNVLIITERPTKLDQLAKVVERLDEAESQVMIEAKIAEIKQVDGSNKGIDWSVLKAYSGSIGNPAGVPVNGYAAGINRTFVPKDSSFTRGETIIFNASQFSLILRALETDNKVKLVASPNVVTMNNTKAEINIARRVPVPNYSYNQQTGTFEVSGFNYENIGVLLDVTPKAQQDLITLDIKPELSDSSESVRFGSDTSPSKADIPIINTRRSQSIVTIESGYTLALGGMMKENDTDITNKLPLFGSIPGPVGKLFSSTVKTKEKTNLIIFVTATRIGFNGVPYVQFKGNIPGNLDLKALEEIQYSERDMPQYQLSQEEKDAIEKVRQLKNNQDKMAYLMKLQTQVEKLEGKEGSKTDSQENVETLKNKPSNNNSISKKQRRL